MQFTLNDDGANKIHVNKAPVVGALAIQGQLRCTIGQVTSNVKEKQLN